jgi:hypothetical protein
VIQKCSPRARARCLQFERLALTERGSLMVANRAGGEMRVVGVGVLEREGAATVSLASSTPNTEHRGGVALIVRDHLSRAAGRLSDHQHTELVHSSGPPPRVNQLQRLPHICFVNRKFTFRPQTT